MDSKDWLQILDLVRLGHALTAQKNRCQAPVKNCGRISRRLVAGVQGNLHCPLADDMLRIPNQDGLVLLVKIHQQFIDQQR